MSWNRTPQGNVHVRVQHDQRPRSDARYRGIFDFNHNGQISSLDYLPFSNNFGKALFLPA